jgi:phosphoribosylanthranilate isomerase
LTEFIKIQAIFLKRTRIKICGITRVEDALSVVESGADAIGLVFYPPSPRHIDISKARLIVASIPAFVTVVALFVNETDAMIRTILKQVPIDMLQFHGDETPEFCASFHRPYVKAIRMKENTQLDIEQLRYKEAKSLLVDAYEPGKAGGTGKTFNWSDIPDELSSKLILAGGLSAENVQDAVHSVHPWAVDVSGGVELSPGIKSHEKIQQFIEEVNSADSN